AQREERFLASLGMTDRIGAGERFDNYPKLFDDDAEEFLFTDADGVSCRLIHIQLSGGILYRGAVDFQPALLDKAFRHGGGGDALERSENLRPLHDATGECERNLL